MDHIPPPSNLPPGSIVDAYLRDSGGLKQDRSVPRQLEAITAFCNQFNFILRTPFQDAARSGKSTTGRDDFNRMIAAYELPANRPAALLIWNYARFARDVDDSQLYKALIRKWGVIIHSLTDQVPEGRFARVIETLIETANQEKREQTARDAADGLRSIVQQGAMPGLPPRGFMREPLVTSNYRTGEQRTNHRWVPDPDWLPRIRRAFELRAAGHSLYQIHQETHIHNSLNSYRTFFSNPLYIGRLRFGALVIDDYCAPMVDRQTWDAVQRILELHAQRGHLSRSEIHPRRQSSSYLLSGLVRCARCNSTLYGMTSGQRSGKYYYRYACSRSARRRDCGFRPVPARPLERDVLATLQDFVAQPDNLAELLELDRQQNENLLASNELASAELQKQLRLVRRSISNLTAAIAESGHSQAMLSKLSAFEAEQADLQSRLLQLKEKMPASVPALTGEQILALSQRLSANLASKDPVEVRTVLRSITKSIIIDRQGNKVYGLINYYHCPRESISPPFGGDPFTASKSLTPVGALS